MEQKLDIEHKPAQDLMVWILRSKTMTLAKWVMSPANLNKFIFLFSLSLSFSLFSFLLFLLLNYIACVWIKGKMRSLENFVRYFFARVYLFISFSFHFLVIFFFFFFSWVLFSQLRGRVVTAYPSTLLVEI